MTQPEIMELVIASSTRLAEIADEMHLYEHGDK